MTEEFAKIDPQAAPREVLRAWFQRYVGFDPFDDGWDEADLRVAVDELIQAERRRRAAGAIFGTAWRPSAMTSSFERDFLRAFEAA